MDLGIAGRSAIICASSRGLGKACALALAQEGCRVLINGRDAEQLKRTAAEVETATGHRPLVVRGDLNTDEGRAALIAACPAPDILITNNGGPAPGRIEDWDHAAWLQAIEANMLSAILLIQGVVGGMRERRFGRIINITSVIIGTGVAGLSSALSAAHAGAGVTLVAEGRDLTERGGNTQLAQGGIAAAIGAHDHPSRHASDTVAAGAEIVTVSVRTAPVSVVVVVVFVVVVEAYEPSEAIMNTRTRIRSITYSNLS